MSTTSGKKSKASPKSSGSPTGRTPGSGKDVRKSAQPPAAQPNSANGDNVPSSAGKRGQLPERGTGTMFSAPQKLTSPHPCHTSSPQIEEPVNDGRAIRFTGHNQTFSVPSDQECPLDVWNVYSPVRYVSKKEQRALESSCKDRTAEILEYCQRLFESKTRPRPNAVNNTHGKGGALNGDAGTVAREEGADGTVDRNSAAAASFVMSMWPGLPIENRPAMSHEAETIFPILCKGTPLCIFNEEMDSPTRCIAALRLLRNLDGDEGSIAIYNSADMSAIDGYIPLTFLHSVTRKLEYIERTKHVRNGVVRCRCDDGKVIIGEYTRAFTLHCRSPQKFYVSFIAFNDADLNMWIKAVSYFIMLNTDCKMFLQTAYDGN